MDSNKVEMYIATSGQKFPAERLMEIKQKLEQMDDNKFMIIQGLALKDPTTMLIISILLGTYGVVMCQNKDSNLN